MSRTLILPDIHHEILVAQAIIENEHAQKVIHLGDHQDGWDDTPQDALNTAVWTRARLQAGDTILLGNHDLQYVFPHRLHACSGVTYQKEQALRNFFTLPEREGFHVWVQEQGWLLSHAGFLPHWLLPTGLPVMGDGDLMEGLLHGHTHPLLHGCGARRGGSATYPGCLWLDWGEFLPTQGVQQIVGHTQARESRCKKWNRDQNWCLDTGLHHYGILGDGKLQIKGIGEMG